MDSDQLILGPRVAQFEAELANCLGVSHAIGVANGTDALELSLRAVGVVQGDRVITVSHTAGATLRAILRVGATPLLVDIDPHSYTLDVAQTHTALERFERVRAIAPVHLYGHPAELLKLQELAQAHDVALVEDCAQAFGAQIDGKPVGAFGAAASFSFYPTKNLSALGDGGAVVTQDAQLAQRLRTLREYGWSQRQYAESFGTNSRLDELQAALLQVKLAAFSVEQAHRGELAARYTRNLQSLAVQVPSVAPNVVHAWHLYVIRLAQRDQVCAWLRARGVPLQIHYPHPAHHQPAYRLGSELANPLPHTESAALEIVSLPLHPHMSFEDVDWISAMLSDALDNAK